MKPIGAFRAMMPLEYGTQPMDEYGIEYVHMHLPIFLDAVKELYIEIGPQPEGIERGAYEKLRKLIGELRDIGLKFFLSYPVFSRPQIA